MRLDMGGVVLLPCALDKALEMFDADGSVEIVHTSSMCDTKYEDREDIERLRDNLES